MSHSKIADDTGNQTGLSSPLHSRREFLKKVALGATGAAMAWVTPSMLSLEPRTAYAAGTNGGRCDVTYSLEVPGREVEIEVFDTGGQSLTEFYGYDTWHPQSASTPFRFELIGTDILVFFLVRGPDGQVSLGTVVDRPYDQDNGGAQICYSGLPHDIHWSVKDDPNEIDSSDHHTVDGAGNAIMDVKWDAHSTDGGILSSDSGGLDCEFKITIENKSLWGIRYVCFATPVANGLYRMYEPARSGFCLTARCVEAAS